MPSPFNTSDLPCSAGDLVTSGSDQTLAGNARWLRANAAGSVVLRYPGSVADVTLTAVAAEYIPVCPGVIVRSTTAVVVHVLGV